MDSIKKLDYIEFCQWCRKVGCFKPNYGAPEPHMRTTASLDQVTVKNGVVSWKK